MQLTPIQSKLSITLLIPLGLLLFITSFLAYILTEIINTPDLPSILPYLVVGPFFIIIWLWLVFGELRKKTTKVILTEDLITFFDFAGITTGTTLPYSYFDSIKTSILSTRLGNYEYLYLIKEGKKIVCLSQFYHLNYSELKECLIQKAMEISNPNFRIEVYDDDSVE